MKSFRTLIAAAVLAVLSFAVPAVLAGTASAAAVPVIYNDVSGWHGAAVRPQWVYVGEGGSPVAHTWSWSTWNATTAKSTGTLWVNSCKPDCAQGRESYHTLQVTLYWVKSHAGTRYFSAMEWHTPGYRLPGQHSSTVWLHFSPAGGTSPSWH